MTSFELMQVLCTRRETGMMFALTKDGHQLRVGFLNGAIVHVAYSLRAGAEALLRVKRTTAVSSSFSRGIVAGRDLDLPDRDVLMDFFAPILSNGTVTPTSERNVSAGPPALQRAGGMHATSPIDPPIEQLRRLALEFLGPIGSVLLDEALASGVPPWPLLVSRLADQLPSAATAQAFRAEALKITA